MSQYPNLRVLLCSLSIRTSERGNDYLSGSLGASRLVGFKAKERDPWGNEQWSVYLVEREPKPDRQVCSPALEKPSPRALASKASTARPKPSERRQASDEPFIDDTAELERLMP